MRAIKISKKGAGDKTICVASNGDPNFNCGGAVNAHMLFFVKA